MQLQVRHQLSSSANERVKTVLSIDLSTRQQPSSHSITQRSRAGCSAAPACFLEQMKRWGDGSPPASLGPQPTRWACWHGFALGVTQRVRDAVCSFPPGFLHSNSRWRVGNVLLFATTTGIVLWASRLHPWEEPLPTAVPAEPPRPSPCTPPAASRGARATPPSLPSDPSKPFSLEDFQGGLGCCSKLQYANKEVEERVFSEPKSNGENIALCERDKEKSCLFPRWHEACL